MNDTPTPETDDATLRAIDIDGGGEFDAVHVQVAKRLERERDAMRLEAVKYINLWDRATKDLEIERVMIDRLKRIELAARALIKAKGRHHSKIAYECIEAALDPFPSEKP